MLTAIRKRLRRPAKPDGFSFSRPLVLLQSDDWGRVGVRDREGYERLRASGVRLGERPYDFYSLETAEDVQALAAMLDNHHDCAGHPASLTMNFCTANFDFDRMRAGNFSQLTVLPIGRGLPGKWSRPGLKEAVLAGVEKSIFFPSLHGTIHCSPVAVERALASGGERAEALRRFWNSETPYIHWRMPWIGYEYENPEPPGKGMLPFAAQRKLIADAHANFKEYFGFAPISACAPGYRANESTHRAWSEIGIRVAQNGTGDGLRSPFFDQSGILHLYRSVDFEPSARELETEKYLEIASTCFARGLPFIISAHSINFHSTVRDFRSATIAALDQLLTALEMGFPNLLYVNDGELYAMVAEGAGQKTGAHVEVHAKARTWNTRALQEVL